MHGLANMENKMYQAIKEADIIVDAEYDFDYVYKIINAIFKSYPEKEAEKVFKWFKNLLIKNYSFVITH